MTWFKNLKVRSKLLAAFILVLAIAIFVNVFTLIQLVNTDDTYTDGIEVIDDQFGHVFTVRGHFARARMIIREIYYPNNTMTELNDLYAEMDSELIAAKSELAQLREVTPDDLKDKIDSISPLLDRYHTDTKAVIDILRSVGFVDIENQDYREAMSRAQETTVRMTNEYAGLLNSEIDGLSDLFLKELQHTSAALSNATSQIEFVVIIILVIMVVVILAIALYIPILISKPLAVVTDFMKKASVTGDLSLRQEDVRLIEEYSKTKDEIGQLIACTAGFVKEINHEMDILEKIADGDLTVQPNLLSDKDKIGKSLTKVVDNLNFMFNEINTAAAQVSFGSKQISDGAQSLAQGSTEQAATIEKLSSSISGIAEKTKDNAVMAGKAATLAGTIRNNAEKGNSQMNEMIDAAKDINTSSQNISKIIKVIDDIAFQTNILALNAAVEAARAGQHGKGFAVVAEEVRNLAAKSAEAANDTSNMIQDSMEKAALGTRIANDTAASLAEIVSGISESTNLVTEIAKSSEEQSAGIAQINIGIDQVVQVVQQNSAMAEESAAAAEEMSGQSNMLQQHIAQFKLRNSGGMYRNLPSMEKPPKANGQQMRESGKY